MTAKNKISVSSGNANNGDFQIPQKQLSPSELLVLEPRILFDGAAVATGIDVVGGNEGEGVIEAMPATINGGIENNAALFEALSGASEIASERTEIVFVDTSVENYETLLQEFDAGVEIVLIDSTGDGVEQIASVLSDRQDIDAVHIISHGNSGTLELGTTKLTAISIDGKHADEMAVIANAMSGNGDILIYGCNFGQYTRGENAVEALATATGADVAASNDLTGAAQLGGDWDLEVKSGEIEAFAISPSNWMQTLDLTINDVSTVGANGLATAILGDGVTVNSVSFSGSNNQAGTFVTGAGTSFGANILNFTDGAIFSSGTAVSAGGPNSASGFTVNAPGGIDGDADFDALAGNNTFDASFVEISFTPDIPPGASAGDTGRMTIEIVFGSDEYNEYVYGGVNDTLAVIVNGNNQAVVPNGLPIGIDTINDAGTFNPTFGNPANDPNPEHVAAGFESAAPSLYTNNSGGVFNTQLDGFTITVPVTFDVIVGQANTIKLGIADTGDAAFDSWMFVKGDSGQTVIVAENDSVTTPTDVPFTLDVTANDYDLQGDTLTVTHILDQPVVPGDTITLASGATVTVEANGDLTVAGDGTNTALDTFTYQISDGNGGSSIAFVSVDITAVNTPPIAVDDGPIAVTGGVVENFDPRTNDIDPDGPALAVTHIIDAADPGVQIALAFGVPVTLSSGTQIELLADGTLDITTTALGFGNEAFDYVLDDGSGVTDIGTITLDRAQGSLITVPATVSGIEDNNIPLGITVDPALTSGGSQLDIIGTEAGFRDASAGATPTTFTIPPNATSVRITAYGGNDNGGNNNEHEDYQTTSMVVDLVGGTYSGHTFIQFGQSTLDADNYAFSDVALGSASNSGATTGDTNDGYNAITVSTSGNVLSIVETQGSIDQAYLVEYLTADGSSTNFLGSLGDVQNVGDTDSTFSLPASANIVILTIQDGRGGLGPTHEDKGLGRIVVDLDTGLASGTVFAQFGRGGNNTAGYSFTGYDITSGLSVLASGATIVGDAAGSANLLPDYTITTAGSDLTLTRAAGPSGFFTSLVSVQSYERLNIGSGASSLGSSEVAGNYIDDIAIVNTFDLAIAGSSQTGVITLAMPNITGTNAINENTGGAQVFVDLVNGTTSGSFLIMRSATPDLVSWTDVPFGTRLIDHANTISNHAVDTDFGDEIAGVMTFDVVLQPDGSQVLRASAQAVSGDGSSAFTNYAITMQAQWAGSLPIEISGAPSGGSFSAGSFNPTTGNWEIDPADVAGLEFAPPANFSGNTFTFVADYNGNQQPIAVAVTRVADAPSLTTVDQAGDEDTTIDISTAVAAALVDTDGSETITLVQLEDITIGHTIDDGTNSFTASLGNQNVDVTSWNLGGLAYTAPADINGVFNVNVRAQTTDSDGFSATDDTAESTDSFNVTINSVNDAPTLDNDGNDSAGVGAGGYETTFTENAVAVGIVDSDVDIADIDSDLITEATITLTNGQIGDVLNIGGLPVGLAAITVPNPPGPLAVAGPIAVTVFGGGTTADYEAALQAITFQTNGENPDTTDRTLNIQVSENADSSNITSTTIHVTAVNDSPVLDLDGDNSSGVNSGNFATTYTENEPALAIADVDTIIQDLDDTNIESATITLTNGQIGDLMSIGALPAGITLVGIAPTALAAVGSVAVQLTGSATVADYQTALAAIGFSSTSEDPDTTQRAITVVVNDGDVNSNTSTNFVTVLKANDAPVAVDDAATTNEDTGFSVAVATGLIDTNDTDADASDTLVVSHVNGAAGDVGNQITLPSGALLTVNGDGSYDYDPNGAFEGLAVGENGADSFTYQISDGNGGTDTATVNLTVTGVNDAPVAVVDTATTDEDTGFSVVAAAGLIDTNDTDADTSDTLVVSQVNGSAVDVGNQITLPSGALLTVNGDGSYDYDPNGAFEGLAVGENGADSFTYQISDGNGGTDMATVALTITGVNDVPDAVDDVVTTDEDTALSFAAAAGLIDTNDTDADASDTLVVSQVNGAAGDVGNQITLPSGALLTVNGDGSYDYDPNGAFEGLAVGENGADSFTYQISDGNGGTDTATVNLTVTGVNDAPVAVVDTATTDEDTGFSVAAAAGLIDTNDTDADASDTLVVSQVNGAAGDVGNQITLPSGALLTVNADGSYDYDPNGAFEGLAVGENGTDSFTYQISDGNGGTDMATVNLTVTGVNDAPDVIDPVNPTIAPVDPNNIIPDIFSNDGDTLAAIDASAFFSDPDGDTLTFSVTDLPAGLSIDPVTGIISGTVGSSASQGGNDAVNAPGVYEAIVTADDGNGGVITTTLTYTISNPAPVAIGILPDLEQHDGDDVSIDTAGVFDDPDGDTLTFTVTGLPVGLSIDPVTGEISGQIDDVASNDGPYLITVFVDDGEGGVVSVMFTMEVLSNGLPLPPQTTVGLGPDATQGNGASGQGGAGAVPTNILTQALDDIESLDGGPDLGPGQDSFITELVAWIGEQGKGWMDALLSSDGYDTHVGQSLDLDVTFEAAGENASLRIRTLVIEDAVFVELLSVGANADLMDRLAVLGADGSAMPDTILRIDQHSLVINQIVAGEWISFRLKAAFDDGASEYWNIKIDMSSGEVFAENHVGGKQSFHGFTEQLQRLVNLSDNENKQLFDAFR